MVEVLLEWMALGVAKQRSGLLDTGESLLSGCRRLNNWFAWIEWTCSLH